MKTVILAGGLGTRLREETEFKPKPMIPIGGKPILWHIMKTYAHLDNNNFIICTGYRGEVIREYFKNFDSLNLDITVKIGRPNVIQMHGNLVEEGWNVTISDTGAETMTGGRLYKIRDYVGSETFFCTYGDGVSNININNLLEFHKTHGRIATITTVNPVSRFGSLDLNFDGSVDKFREKPQTEGWINAGFFVFEKKIFDYLSEDSILEGEPLYRLAEEGQLTAYKHRDFWQPMDTYRETVLLNKMWQDNSAPWKVWK